MPGLLACDTGGEEVCARVERRHQQISEREHRGGSVSDPIIEGFRGMSTANISDALDRLNLPGSAFDIHPLQNGQKMIGRAFTIQYVPAGNPPGTVGDYIDDIGPDQVVVLDNDGRRYCTVW